jgi:hypothetical protein
MTTCAFEGAVEPLEFGIDLVAVDLFGGDRWLAREQVRAPDRDWP